MHPFLSRCWPRWPPRSRWPRAVRRRAPPPRPHPHHRGLAHPRPARGRAHPVRAGCAFAQAAPSSMSRRICSRPSPTPRRAGRWCRAREEFPGHARRLRPDGPARREAGAGAALAGVSVEAARTERRPTSAPAAALLSAYAEELKVDRSDLGAWAPVVAQLAASPTRTRRPSTFTAGVRHAAQGRGGEHHGRRAGRVHHAHAGGGEVRPRLSCTR